MHTVRIYAKLLPFLGQILGVCSGVALMMIGVYSEDLGAPHMTASSAFFTLTFIVLILIILGLLLNSQFQRILRIYGLAITFSALILEIFWGGPIVEWYTVLGSLVFVGLPSSTTYRFQICIK